MSRLSRAVALSLAIVGAGLVQLPAGANDDPQAPTHPVVVPSPWAKAALKYKVDVIDLYAIAFQESRRRRGHDVMQPWPWTLNSPVTGALYFETYEQALEKLNELISTGERNIDVGMMGINWYFNGHRARDPASLLNVSDNIFIAAQIYSEHLNRFSGDRRKAIAHYHSATAAHGRPYAAAVLAIADHLRVTTGVHLALQGSLSQNP